MFDIGIGNSAGNGRQRMGQSFAHAFDTFGQGRLRDVDFLNLLFHRSGQLVDLFIGHAGSRLNLFA